MDKPQQVVFSPWGAFLRVKAVSCTDGRFRTARITGGPLESLPNILPASVSARGRAVSGYLETDSDGHWRFIANSYGKNAHAIPRADQIPLEDSLLPALLRPKGFSNVEDPEDQFHPTGEPGSGPQPGRSP